MSARETTVTGRRGSLRGPAASIVRRRGYIGGHGEHWHLGRDTRGRFRTTSQENPIDFVKDRALWLGGLALVSAAVVGGIVYAAGRSAGTTMPTQTPAGTTPGAASATTPAGAGAAVPVALTGNSSGQSSVPAVSMSVGGTISVNPPSTGTITGVTSTVPSVIPQGTNTLQAGQSYTAQALAAGTTELSVGWTDSQLGQQYTTIRVTAS